MKEQATDSIDALALRLALSLSRLRSRIREGANIASTGLSLTQLSILKRLEQQGETTAARLALDEHISQQAIAQNIAPLKSAGLVIIRPDTKDRRKMLIQLSPSGLELRESMATARNTWLVQAITSTMPSEDIAGLEQCVELLERLAAATI